MKSTGASEERKKSLLEVRLARDSRAPDGARRALKVLRPLVNPSTYDDVKLLVSELVTNSVQHAGPDSDSWVGVRLYLLPKTVRVEVTDSGPGFRPRTGTVPRDRDSGRGLYLVGAISDRWGIDREGITRVWFEIAASA